MSSLNISFTRFLTHMKERKTFVSFILVLILYFVGWPFDYLDLKGLTIEVYIYAYDFHP